MYIMNSTVITKKLILHKANKQVVPTKNYWYCDNNNND